jgi:hypothetical protein
MLGNTVSARILALGSSTKAAQCWRDLTWTSKTKGGSNSTDLRNSILSSKEKLWFPSNTGMKFTSEITAL